MGIVIDNSGSMRDKRPQVNAAAINLVRASNPQDQVFVVNFNEEYFLDQDYTGSVPKLKDALERIESRGGTALYDAVVASADHLKKSGALEKKVLLVVTDGEDNASRESLEQACAACRNRMARRCTPSACWAKSTTTAPSRALREMAEETGGVAFFPKDLSEVERHHHQIAHDIRNQYTIGYKPTEPQSAGGYRTVRSKPRRRATSISRCAPAAATTPASSSAPRRAALTAASKQFPVFERARLSSCRPLPPLPG